MAGNFISIGSKFRPFSYSELLAPVQMAQEAHVNLENQLGDLSTQASVWEKLANEQNSPEAYGAYKNYIEQLDNQSSLLAKQGLTQSSRKALHDMRSKYAQDIVPIERAYTKRDELMKEERQRIAADPSLIIREPASTLSLDTLIRDQAYMPASVSGDSIYKYAASAALQLKGADIGKPVGWRKTLEGQYWEKAIKKGFTVDEVNKVINGDPNANPVLTKIFNDSVESTGISEWATPEQMNIARAQAARGLLSAVGDTQYQMQSNKGYDYAMKEAEENRARARKAQEDATKNAETAPRTPTYDFGVRPQTKEQMQSSKITKGLRASTNGIGYSTAKIDNLSTQRQKLLEEKATLEKEEPRLKEYKGYEPIHSTPSRNAFGSAPAPQSSNIAKPKYWNTYNKINRKIEELDKNLTDEYKSTSDLANRYSSLGATDFERISLGQRLDAVQQQSWTSKALSLRGSDYNNVREGISNLITGLGTKALDSETIGLFKVEEDGKQKKLNSSDTNKLLEDIKTATVGADDTFGTYYMINGEKYISKGISEIDKANRNIVNTSKYLSDFTTKGMGNVFKATPEQASYINKRGVSVELLQSLNPSKISGTDYYGTTVDTGDGNIIKILFDPNTGTVISSSLDDILNNGGTNLRSQKNALLSNSLTLFPQLVAPKSE